MNINIPFKVTALTFMLCATIQLGAQNKSAIILINSIPYNVVLANDGEITEIKGEAKGYMRGYIRSADEFEISVDRTIDIAGKVDEGSSVRSQRSLLSFETNYATLNESAVKALDKVISGFSFSSADKIMITAFKENQDDTDKLATNRIATCRTYLELKGIPLNRILTEVAVSAPLKDKISITYIQ